MVMHFCIVILTSIRKSDFRSDVRRLRSAPGDLVVHQLPWTGAHDWHHRTQEHNVFGQQPRWTIATPQSWVPECTW